MVYRSSPKCYYLWHLIKKNFPKWTNKATCFKHLNLYYANQLLKNMSESKILTKFWMWATTKKQKKIWKADLKFPRQSTALLQCLCMSQSTWDMHKHHTLGQQSWTKGEKSGKKQEGKKQEREKHFWLIHYSVLISCKHTGLHWHSLVSAPLPLWFLYPHPIWESKSCHTKVLFMT